MRHLLATTFIIAPALAWAQTPETIFSEGAGYLGEAGLQVDVESMTSTPEGLLLSGFSLYPAGDPIWRLDVDAMVLSLSGQEAVLAPGGDITAQMRFPGIPVPLEFEISEEELEMRVFIDMRAGNLTGFSVQAEELSAALVGAFATQTALDAVVSIESFSFTEQELSVVEMTQVLGWENVSIMLSANPDPERESGQLVAEFGQFEMEIETLQAGLLEEFPWVAAVGAGMRVNATGELARSGVTTIVRPSADSQPNIQRYELGRMSFGLEQSEQNSSMEASLLAPSVTFERPADGMRFMVRGEVMDLAALAPLHQAVDAVESFLSVSVADGQVVAGDIEMPFALDMRAQADVLPIIDWLDYSIVTGDANWRDPNRVFAVQSLSVDDGVFALGGDTIGVNVDVTSATPTQPALMPDMIGTAQVVASSTQTLLDILGNSGLVNEEVNDVIIQTLQVMFGPDAGVGGGTAAFEFAPGWDFQVNGRSLQ